MPPSHRSSSSHSSSRSSSHSSSRSSSSHSSSSFRSSGSSSSFRSSSSFSSGPSRRSTSSHGSSGYYGSSRSFGSASTPSIPARPRHNQPMGYQSGVHGPAPRTYHCRKHDYVYYSTSWVSPQTGKSYQKGYYDEEGNRYEDILIKDGMVAKFTCPYCDTEVKTSWSEGKKPVCPNCSAQMDEPMVDEVIEAPVDGYWQTQQKKRSPKVWIIILAVLAMFGLYSKASESTTAPDPTYSYTSQQSDEMYVEELGRSCMWYSAYDSYYDPITDCYFVYNDQTDTPQWQYWYEGISSDYGDYGWMEYDFAENQWYIETDNSVWVPLPDTYDTSYLWHING